MREEELSEIQDRPGHNGTGRLKSGNTKNVGRKPSEVRARYLAAADQKYIWDVADGKKVIRVVGKTGRNGKQELRFPTHQERMQAIEMCAKFGLGTKAEVTSGEEPIKAYVNVNVDAV